MQENKIEHNSHEPEKSYPTKQTETPPPSDNVKSPPAEQNIKEEQENLARLREEIENADWEEVRRKMRPPKHHGWGHKKPPQNQPEKGWFRRLFGSE